MYLTIGVISSSSEQQQRSSSPDGTALVLEWGRLFVVWLSFGLG
jgi:hypothetical protein